MIIYIKSEISKKYYLLDIIEFIIFYIILTSILKLKKLFDLSQY